MTLCSSLNPLSQPLGELSAITPSHTRRARGLGDPAACPAAQPVTELRWEPKHGWRPHAAAPPPRSLETSRKRVCSISRRPGGRPARAPWVPEGKPAARAAGAGAMPPALGNGRLRERSQPPILPARAVRGFPSQPGRKGIRSHRRFDLHTQPGCPGQRCVKPNTSAASRSPSCPRRFPPRCLQPGQAPAALGPLQEPPAQPPCSELLRVEPILHSELATQQCCQTQRHRQRPCRCQLLLQHFQETLAPLSLPGNAWHSPVLGLCPDCPFSLESFPFAS